MPTDEERREVAENLRDMAKAHHAYDRGLFFASLIRALLMDRGASVSEIMLRLADLIEPEKRNCRRIEGVPFPRCSECGAIMGLAFNFCSECGAKVVE